MTVDKNVPDIRFKEFSGEWGKSPLGSLCLIGDIDHRMPESKITGIPYLMTGDFYGINGLDFSNAKLISIEDYEQLSKKIKPEFGDILFARYASVGAVRYVETDIKFLISYSCAILKTNNTTYGTYLFYFFQTEKTQGQFELGINTGSQRNIGIDSLKSLLVALPKPDEQTQIGNYFQKLDNLINHHQQKHDKLSNIKKAMLEKMFPKQGETIPEIRFKGFNGEWLSNSIGEICGATFGGGTPSTNDKDFWQGEIPWIQSSDIKDGSVTSVTAKKYITKTAVNKSATKLISGNSIAIVTRVGVGKLSLMQGEYATSQDFLSLSDIKIDSQYAVYVIWKQLQIEKEQVQGTSIKGITKDELLGKFISYPKSEKEQTAIGNYFQKLDTLINQHQQQITKLNNIKQACLSKMFV
ncbi:restriction endonuclease subunit S [Vibrio aestuarianus subsp. cardii]|uniref:restriction endonuclease subunit S n=1 Tax=Vibrio aestuarianus TaxID=28171 RepID=UPI001593CD3C|nr:restriction endonuclease subunit S [Vibrio aestuarianus]MDE1309034.1 restriction endonuclease subunit S [Vibrio aestuarianus]NGZ91018.1 restriction endonuclease subunit S [Vibrio aestuarianus subsp. cardii]